MENPILSSFLEFHIPTKIRYGCGLARDLKDSLSPYGTHIFVITDKTLRSCGVVQPLLEAIPSGFEIVAVFDDVPPNSETQTVQRAYELLKEHPADILLAIGGGSVMDTAKSVNILKTKGGSLMDYQGVGVLEDPLEPLICIPTTAGTGSEVTKFAIIKDNESQQKVLFVSPTLCPNIAILDPTLLLSLPPKISAACGMDALTHAIESLVAQQRNILSEACAFHTIRLVHRHLQASIQDGSHLEHRGAMLLASTLGGMAFNDAGVGVVHALAHPLGAHCNVPHGLANAIMLPYGIRFNGEIAQEKYEEIASLFGIASHSPVATREALCTHIQNLSKACGLPTRLRDVGVHQDQLDTLASEASCDGALYTNPKEATAEQLRALYEEAY